MFNWFLVTSAINVSYNNSTVEGRFLQTLETIDSIKKYCTNSKIVLLEGSTDRLNQNHFDRLIEKIGLYVPFYDDELIQKIHKNANGNMQLVKSPSEIHMLHTFLTKQTFIAPIDRIFKISGRHVLNSNFNYINHCEKDKIVVKNKEPSVTYYDRETKKIISQLTDFQYKTRLYSFCGTLIPYMISKYSEMLNKLFELYSIGEFSDVEHIMYYVLQDYNVKQIPILGLSGASAENEQLVNE